MPADRMLSARLRTSGAIRYAPRVLRVTISGDDLLVRDERGRLVRLEVGGRVAFTDRTGDVVETDGTDAVLLPRDTGAEAQAIVSPAALCAWLDAVIAADDAHGDGGRRLALTTGDGRAIEAHVDESLGVVVSVRGESSAGPFALDLDGLVVADRRDDIFTPAGDSDRGS